MEKKSRYCPSCGNKTNDVHCDICGRTTKPISMRSHEQNLDIIEDDIAQEKHENFTGDRGQKESVAYHRMKKQSTLKMKQGEHPYYEQPSTKPQGTYTAYIKAFATLFSVLAIIVVACIVLGIFVAGDTDDQEVQSSYATFYDYLFQETIENDELNLDCSITTDKKKKTYITIHNKSPYFIDGDMYLDDLYVDYQRMVAPHSTKTYATDEKRNGVCDFEPSAVYRYEYHEPSISFQVKEEKDTVKIYVHDTEEEPIKDLLMYLVSSYSITDNLNQKFELYVDNKLGYKLDIKEEDTQIKITFHEQKGHAAISEFHFQAND